MRKIALSLFSMSVLLFMASSLYAERLPVDLTAHDIYIREGFEPLWAAEGPSLDEIGNLTVAPEGEYNQEISPWIRLAGKANDRPVRVMNLSFTNKNKRPLFSLGQPPRTFTFCIPLNFESTDIEGKSLGLFLPQIGQGWEVYVNGKRAVSQLFLDSDGRINLDRSVRNQVVELPAAYLHDGRNILSFRITGDPTVDRTGFFVSRNYKIDYFDKLTKDTTEYLDIALIGIYFFFGLYHLVLFLRRRKEKFNLTFGLATITLAIYFFMRTRLVYDIIPDTGISKALELIAMFMMMPAFVLFFDRIVRDHITKFSKAYLIYSVFMALLVLPFEKEILLIWQGVMILPLLYMLIYDIGIPLVREQRRIYRESGGYPLYTRISRAFISSFVLTIPGNLALGTFVVFFTGMLDMISLKTGRAAAYSKYGFFFLILGLVVMLANRFLRVHKEIEDLNLNLEHKVEDRTKQLKKANDEIAAAMEEVEAINETLTTTNRDLEDAQRIAAMDMKMAARVQESFFPKRPPHTGKWDVSFIFKPMSGVSGDLYDFSLLSHTFQRPKSS